MASRNPIERPVVAIPPLRPEAPKATVSRSKTATLAPLRARCRAADSPVSPAPTTATSTSPPISVVDRSGPGVRRVEPVRRELHRDLLVVQVGVALEQNVFPDHQHTTRPVCCQQLAVDDLRRSGDSSGHEQRDIHLDTPPAAPSGPDAGRAPDAPSTCVDPEDGELVGTVGDCSAADVDEAVRARGAGGALRTALAGVAAPRGAAPGRGPAARAPRGCFAELISREGCKTDPRRGARGAARGRDGAPLRRAGRPPRGPDPPVRRHPSRGEPARLVHPGAGRRRRRDHALQRPAQPGRPQGRRPP